VTKVGFIGLGDMGGGMVRRVIDAGFPTVVWSRRPEVALELAGPTVEVATTAADLAARCDLVEICVWTDDDVRSVLEGEHGVLAGARPGTVVAIHSTVAPATCRDLERVAAMREVMVLDAPVSGGRDAALAGTLAVAVGGDEDAAARCRPVFESFGDPVVYVGPVGAAQAVKLVNNALLAANLAIADDALSLGDAFGVQRGAMAQWLRSGSGRSYGLDVVMGMRGSEEMRAAARPALEKDVHALEADSGADGGDAALLLEAAEEALRRLADPPATWTSGNP
jgi:3-hydroxyisobutyrate dehydrogenase-like beta-hydroxyacid dehydrogenase